MKIKLTLIGLVIAGNMVTASYIGFGGIQMYDGTHTNKEIREYNESGVNPASCIWSQDNGDGTYSLVRHDD